MAVYTPRGLKIRLPVEYAFALMARLYPKVDAACILQTAEGIDQMNSMLALLAGGACLIAQLAPLQFGSIVFIFHLTGYFLSITGVLLGPGLVLPAYAYSRVSGFGSLTIFLTVAAITGGWQSAVAYLVTILLANIVEQPIEFMLMGWSYKRSGMTLGSAERSFVNAYRVHAWRFEKSLSVNISDAELKKSNWLPTFTEFRRKCAAAAIKCTSD